MASSIINSDDGSVSGTTGLKTTGGDDGALEIQSVGTKYMTVAAGGDISFYEATGTTAKFFWDASAESLGIGTSSPEGTLQVRASTPSLYITSDDLGTGYLYFGGVSTSARAAIYHDDSTDYMAFRTASAERMRIDSSGKLLVAKTTAGFNGERVQIQNANAGQWGLGIGNTDGTSATGCIGFHNSNGAVGSIVTSGSSTSYYTSSDYRLKEDWQPMSGSIDRLKNLNPVNFAWKADGSRVDGFLAHEAAEVVPEAVSGEKDAVEAIGNITDAEGTVVQENVLEPAELAEGQTWTKTEDRPVYQGIDQSKLTPLLTAALQDTLALVEAQAAKIEALETRIAALEV